MFHSQQHLIGDGATLYNVLNMLNQNDSNPKAQLRSLDRTSVIHNDDIRQETSLASKNPKVDTIMIEHFNNSIPALIGKAYKRRNREDRKTGMWMYTFNMTEIENIKKNYQLSRTSEDPEFISTNDIITSWIFSLNPKSNNNTIAVDLRQRLSVLNSDLAGNYLTQLFFNHQQCQKPENIRKQIINMMSNKSTADSPGYQTLPTAEAMKKHIGGLSTSWASFYQSLELEGLELEGQFPVFKPETIDFKLPPFGWPMPSEENIYIFKGNPWIENYAKNFNFATGGDWRRDFKRLETQLEQIA